MGMYATLRRVTPADVESHPSDAGRRGVAELTAQDQERLAVDDELRGRSLLAEARDSSAFTLCGEERSLSEQ